MLVNWCFELSQPLGLKEIFIKRYIVERTNKTEIRPEEQREKTESCRENLWNEIQLKGPKQQKQTQEQNKKEWANSVGLCQRHLVCMQEIKENRVTKQYAASHFALSLNVSCWYLL